MHRSGHCASGTSQALASNDDNGRVPTFAWVLGKMYEACSSVEDVQNVGKKMMRKTVHIARRNILLKNELQIVAVDSNKTPRYDKKDVRDNDLVHSETVEHCALKNTLQPRS